MCVCMRAYSILYLVGRAAAFFFFFFVDRGPWTVDRGYGGAWGLARRLQYLVHVGGTLSRSLCSDVEEHTGEYNDNVY